MILNLNINMLNKKILIVDDEPNLIILLKSILSEYNFYNIETATTRQEAYEKLFDFEPELVILDIMLPDGSGYDILKEIRKTSDIPTLFLSAKDEPEDKFIGFEQGADDYITKPFIPKELIFRITSLLKRCYKCDAHEIVLSSCIVDLSKAEIRKNGSIIQLTATENKILEKLYQNEGRIISIDLICLSIWGDNYVGGENTLMVHIRRLREKIEENPSKPKHLRTVRGLGYKFNI